MFKSIKKESVNVEGCGCRLCLSDELLDDVSRDDQLQEWIMEFLSIEIRGDDRLSQLICTNCRLRLTEFHQFRIRCLEVQNMLKIMAQDESTGAESEMDIGVKPELHVNSASSSGLREQRTGSEDTECRYPEIELLSGQETALHMNLQNEAMEVDPTGAYEITVLEETKLEEWIGDYEKSPNERENLADVNVFNVDTQNGTETGTVEKVSEASLPKGATRHGKHENESTDFICYFCEMQFRTRKKFTKHLGTKFHYNKMRRAQKAANKTMPSEGTDSNRHQLELDESTQIHVCSICKRTFRRKCQLENHVVNHGLLYPVNEDNDLDAHENLESLNQETCLLDSTPLVC